MEFKFAWKYNNNENNSDTRKQTNYLLTFIISGNKGETSIPRVLHSITFLMIFLHLSESLFKHDWISCDLGIIDINNLVC